jgi:hypothetical protein
MAWLGTTDCPCDHRWNNARATLHGMWMRNGWERTTTEAGCPHHGTDAEAAREQRNREAGIW